MILIKDVCFLEYLPKIILSGDDQASSPNFGDLAESEVLIFFIASFPMIWVFLYHSDHDHTHIEMVLCLKLKPRVNYIFYVSRSSENKKEDQHSFFLEYLLQEKFISRWSGSLYFLVDTSKCQRTFVSTSFSKLELPRVLELLNLSLTLQLHHFSFFMIILLCCTMLYLFY